MTNYEYAKSQRDQLLEVARSNAEVLGLVILPEAAEVRQDSLVPENLTQEQLVRLRQNMEATGFGRLEDKGLAESGMLGAAVVIEGGRFPIKVRSELGLVLEEEHGEIVFTGSKYRRLDKEEIEMLGGTGSEYDGSILLMHQQENFVALEKPDPIAFGYVVEVTSVSVGEDGKPKPEYRIDIVDMSSSDQQEAHAEVIGEINGKPVIRLQVNRGTYEFNSEEKYVQPNPGELAELTALMLRTLGRDVSKVATITGGLYAASRSADVIKQNERLASEGSPLIIGMATYGRNRASGGAAPSDKQLVSEVSRLEDLRLGNR